MYCAIQRNTKDYMFFVLIVFSCYSISSFFEGSLSFYLFDLSEFTMNDKHIFKNLVE